MAGKKSEAVAVEQTRVPKDNGEYGDNAKFTWSLKFRTQKIEEMVVIRSNDADDILTHRQNILDFIAEQEARQRAQEAEAEEEEAEQAPPAKKGKSQPTNEIRGEKPTYMHAGDSCYECSNGHMIIKSYTKDGQKRQFLSCSNYPTCQYTALVSKFPKKTA